MSFNWFLNPVMNHYVDFEGRATRQAYWMFVLVQFIIYFSLSLIEGITDLDYMTVAFSVMVFLPSLAIGVRRLHDIGKSGWWFLLSFIPFIGVIILIVFLAKKGNPQANAYGSPDGISDIPVPVPPAPASALESETQ